MVQSIKSVIVTSQWLWNDFLFCTANALEWSYHIYLKMNKMGFSGDTKVYSKPLLEQFLGKMWTGIKD